jgi:hypothetical protein
MYLERWKQISYFHFVFDVLFVDRGWKHFDALCGYLHSSDDMFVWLQDFRTSGLQREGKGRRLRCFVAVASPRSKRLSGRIKRPLHHDVSTRGRCYHGNHPSSTQWPLRLSVLKVTTESKIFRHEAKLCNPIRCKGIFCGCFLSGVKKQTLTLSSWNAT